MKLNKLLLYLSDVEEQANRESVYTHYDAILKLYADGSGDVLLEFDDRCEGIMTRGWLDFESLDELEKMVQERRLITE